MTAPKRPLRSLPATERFWVSTGAWHTVSPVGMFDWYQPRQPLRCPVCDSELDGWQGKDGPCALFVWRQGERSPVDQLAEDVALPANERQRFTLPPEFVFYTDDGSHWITALGRCNDDGTWSTANLLAVSERRSTRRGRVSVRDLWPTPSPPRPL